MARKEYAEAAKAYQTILIDDPHNAKLLNYVGMAYQQLGNGDRAEHYYKLAAKADKTSIERAQQSRHRRVFGASVTARRSSITRRRSPRGALYATVYTNLGYAYCGIKEFPKAIEVFNKALALDPEVFDHKGDFRIGPATALSPPIRVRCISPWRNPTRRLATPSVRRVT